MVVKCWTRSRATKWDGTQLQVFRAWGESLSHGDEKEAGACLGCKAPVAWSQGKNHRVGGFRSSCRSAAACNGYHRRAVSNNIVFLLVVVRASAPHCDGAWEKERKAHGSIRASDCGDAHGLAWILEESIGLLISDGLFSKERKLLYCCSYISELEGCPLSLT